MKFFEALSIVCISLLFVTVYQIKDVHAALNQNIIEDLEVQLKEATTDEEKSRLHMFKARNYIRGGDYERALTNYDQALRLNHKGWIHLERANFFLVNKKYSLAESEAIAAKEETKTLASQADPIIRKAQKELERIYQAEHPPVIIFDTQANAARKSRFDYMRQKDFSKAMKNYSRKLDKERATAEKRSSASPKRRARRT